MRTLDRVAGITAQVSVVLLHAMFFAIFFYYPSNLKIDLQTGNYGYPVVYFLFIATSLALYFAVGFKNPGYIQYNAERGMMLLTDDAPPPGVHEVDGDMDGEDVGEGGRVRFCNVCRIDQPVRTKHCKKCQRCVGRFDHHCFLINNCVGEGNAALFWWYLLFQSLVCLWTIKQVVSCFTEQNSISLWFYVNGFALAGLVIIIGFGLVPVALLALHSYLAMTGQTTWEMMSRKRISYLQSLPAWAYPFSQGLWGNLRTFCCLLPRLSGKWVVPAEITEQHRMSLFSSRHHDCC